MISFTVSMPPTVNHLTSNIAGVGRIKSAEYKRWIKANEWLVKLACQNGRKIEGAYALTIKIGKPDNRKRDLMNFEKALGDLLVSAGAVRDDSDCQRCLIEWSSEHEGAFVSAVPTQPVPPIAKRSAA